MSLPSPETSRKHLHTRSIRVQAYERDDGLVDLDAELIDFKGYDFERTGGLTVKAGDYVHHMLLRITVDDAYTIVDAHADYAASPYLTCATITPEYRDLIGMSLVKNFRGQVKARFGRTAGCTHMTELSLVLPTAAIQANAGRRRKQQAEDPTQRPFQLDGCHALSTKGPEVLRFYPQWYTGGRDETQDEAVTADSSSASS